MRLKRGPAVQAVGRQLAATGGWTQPPHARSLPLQPGVPSSKIGKLRGGPLALSLDQVVGLPQLQLGGGPGCIGVLPLVPPVAKLQLGGGPGCIGVLPLVPPVATLLVELRELPIIESDSSWDRAKDVPL